MLKHLVGAWKNLQVRLKTRASIQEALKEQVFWHIDAVFTKKSIRALVARIQGPCNWIFSRLKLMTWDKSPKTNYVTKYLWVNGPAGLGESILCATY